MKKRRSLTPSSGVPVTAAGVHLMRRDAARREVTERIVLLAIATTDGVRAPSFDGWALNVSRGGVRCILEEKVELGQEYDVTIGAEGDSPLTRRGRIVWIQEEADGSVVGLEFMNLSGMHKAVSVLPPDPALAKDSAKPPGDPDVPPEK